MLPAKSLDEAYANLSNFFLKTGVARGKPHTQRTQNTRLTCLLALLAMAVFEKVTGRKSKLQTPATFKQEQKQQ